MSVRKGDKVWQVTKNGNAFGIHTSKTKSVNAMHTLSNTDATPIEKKDGSIVLDGVGHFRAKEVAVN